MPSILSILQHTPWWVFGLLAFLAVLGVQALRPRTISVWRLLAIPIVFVLWGLVTLAAHTIESPTLLLTWFVAGAAGLAIAWIAVRLDRMAIDRDRAVVTVPGSVLPLVRNLAIFCVKYVLAAAIAIAPDHRDPLLLCNLGVSGLMAGYFVGWLVRFALKYRMAAEPKVVANP